MATSNAIAIKRLEQERDLKLAELKQQYNLKLRELELQKENLAETIRNNLRNYNINLSKNEIQKIANDELNDRESRKILETVRHNLEVELETKRSNMKNEEIKMVENEIAKLDAILTGSKPVGKDAASIAVSALYNQAMLKALGLPNIPDASLEAIKLYLNNGATESELKGRGGNAIQGEANVGFVRYTDKDGTVKKGILKGYQKDPSELRGKGYSGGGEGGGSRGNRRNYEEDQDKEEIVEDFTYEGPDVRRKSYETNANEKKSSEASGSGAGGYQQESSSKETSDGKSAREGTGSKVYYSPGSQTGPGWFH